MTRDTPADHDASREDRRAWFSPAALAEKAIAPIVAAVRAEVRSARDEISERIGAARAGIVLLVVGGAMALVAVALLAATATSLLALVVPIWAALLLVLVLWSILALVLLRVGASRVRRGVPPVPADTIRRIGHDADRPAASSD